MRQPDFPLDPDLAAELEAIDATLGGQIVDAEFAELTELTVMVAAERPQLAPDRARALDERILASSGAAGARRPAGARSWRLGATGWVAGLAVAAVAAAAVIVVAGPGGGGSSGTFNGAASSSASGSAVTQPSSAGSGARRPLSLSSHGAPSRSGSFGGESSARLDSKSANGTGSSRGTGSSQSSSSTPGLSLTPAPAASAGSPGAPSTPAPAPSARKTIQSAQLQLGAPGRWVDVVAQEVFDVVGQEKGIVRNSQVTAATGNNGYATFDLSIPSSNLSDTVTRLSALQHSRVVSRTDGTQDVNGQYLSDQRRLADARALRTSLLKQLANATTQTQIDSLNAQLRDVEAQINQAEATLHRLEYQISFSQLFVTINGGPVPLPLASPSHGSGGFTIGRAAHDALHVLTVAAGVALIVLAALVPVSLLIALGVWVNLTFRRRRREHALDAA
ncbi:MAG TPA: DUF4349 domain-containing protein [Solirubrobacteraceae bacterium]|nr:DUF4349 domain-containing protein [Solirubrobacteraceae bacterium]